MDVKHASLAALQSSMGQAHVDPEKGRQGDFEHWQRIFDATDRPLGNALMRSADANAKKAADMGGRSPQGPRPTAARADQQSTATAPKPAHGAQPAQASLGPVLSESRGPWFALGTAAGRPSMASTTGASNAQPSSFAASAPTLPSSAGLPAPDGRPLAQLEAHLSRGADGRLSVALRSSQPLSSAQALHAVAQALATQDEEAPVEQVLLNGQPIYRSAKPSTHRFEIDC